MDKKLKKNKTITKKEHDDWHKNHSEYDGKLDKEHELCHERIGLKVVKSR
ncbi:hypothetical protein KY320_00940 [Candidatus Woesearchaeota archaeon]|nr:hypothetical protein [Candidatus Woesearchaeota archaeon]